MGNQGNKENLEVDVEKIMAGICERAQNEDQHEANLDCLFDRETDVAGIMRDIRCRVSNCEDMDSWGPGNENEIRKHLKDIYIEIDRINTFVLNTRDDAYEADLNAEPGRVIPVSLSRPPIVQKIFTVIKRFVRKATRFLVLDQMAYNTKISDCVKALCESQAQVLRLTKALAVLSSKQIEYQARMQDDILSAAEQLDELYIEGVNQTKKMLNEVQAQAEINNQTLKRQIENQMEASQALERQIENQMETSQTLKRQIENQMETSQALKEQIEALNRQGDMFSASVAKTILEYRKESGLPIEAPKAQPPAGGQLETEDTYTVLDYFKFQNNFRGSRALITKRQEMYLPYFKDCKAPILDIGCGRGEFLSLLKANKIPAFGIDMYPEYVVEGGLNGLDIRLGDGIEFLQNAQQSFGGIFVCQVIEHISFTQLQTLCAEAYEKLVPGGYLILETPNPRCLALFAGAFYVDPTHNKPVHPLTLEYLLQEIGFEVKIEYTECTRLESLPHIQSDEIKNLDQVNSGISRVSDLLFGSGDYAAIARKP